MISDKASFSVNSGQSATRWIDWLGIFFAILAVLLGVGISLSVGEWGPLVLIFIPLALIFIALIFQPQLGLVAFIIVTFTQLSNIGITRYGIPSIAQPLAGLLMLYILVRITLYGERPLGWFRAGPVLVIYALVWSASLIQAGNFLAASNTFISFAKDALGALIVLYLIQRPSSLKGAIWTLIACGLFMGIISVFQTITGTYSNAYFGFGGWVAQSTGDISRSRVNGPYDNPNAYAQVLVFVVPLALDRLWHERRLLLRIFAGTAMVFSCLTIFFTYSRGGFLALVFALSVLFVLRRPNFFPMLITFLLAFGLFMVLPDTYTSRILSLAQLSPTQTTQITDPAFVGRTSENIAAWHMFLDHPIFGVGLGNYKLNYQDYSRPLGLEYRLEQRTPASLYLEILSEQGIVGIIAFLVLLGLIFRILTTARINFRTSGNLDSSFLVAAIIAGFSGYMFSAIFKNSAYSNVFWMLIGIALASWQVANTTSQQDLETPTTQLGTGL